MREKAVRKVGSPFHSRCETQLKTVKGRTFLQRIQLVSNQYLKISHHKNVFTALVLIFINNKDNFILPVVEELFKLICSLNSTYFSRF